MTRTHRLPCPLSPVTCNLRAARRAFTVAEVLAAMMFVAILVPVIMQAMTLSSRAGTLAERGRHAAELAQLKMDEIVLTNAWQDADASGDFGDDWTGYSWTLSDEAWGEDTMRQLTVDVTYSVQGAEYHAAIATLVEEAEE